VTQNAAVDAADFIATGGLTASSGTKLFNWWIGAVDPVGAFVSYNGNEDQNGDYFTVSVPSDDSRDIAFGWTPHSESDIVDNGTIGLYTVEATESAKVLCYRDSGVHPLLNGNFADGLNHWEHTAGSAQVINDALALLSFDSIGDSSRVEQSRIAVKPNTGYTITIKAKTSIETRTLAIGIVGGQVNTASYDELPAIWQVDTDRVELAGESSDAGDNYYFDIQLDVTTGAADDELTLFLQFENSGTAGQSATVDTLTLTEN
jgi:hypothetical protein